MLKNLEIENFRAFSHLAISRLGRVNLLVGKNGVGKTTVLEALRLYGSVWPARTALHVLYDRDELFGTRGSGLAYSLQAIFFGRDAKEGTEARIGPLDCTVESSSSVHTTDAGKLRIIAEIETQTTTTVMPQWSETGAQGPQGPFAPESLLSLSFVSGDRSFTLSGRGGISYHIPASGIKPPEIDSGPPFLRGKATVADDRDIAYRWDRIALTESEQRAIRALQLITPVRAVSFVESPREGVGRMAKVRVDGMPEPIPLAALGDGVGRMFQIAVAIEHSAGYVRALSETKNLPANVFAMLLLDEMEMGIHHTLHTDLWRFIFKTARELGVQVFAATHSLDCLVGFARAVAESEDNDGLVIRLEKVDGQEETGAVIFDRDDLPIVVRDSIEVR